MTSFSGRPWNALARARDLILVINDPTIPAISEQANR